MKDDPKGCNSECPSEKKLNPLKSFVIQGWQPKIEEGPPMWTTANRLNYKRDNLRYPSDLTGEEWAHIEALIPPAKHGGRKRKVDVREVVNGIMYVLSTGCQWRYVPKDLPPKKHALRLFRPVDLRRHVGDYSSCALCEVSRANWARGQPHRRYHR